MIKFGYFYLNGKLTIYDVSIEVRQGHQLYVAALSEDPRISFAAVRAETAVLMLKDHLEHMSRQRQPSVTWLPGGSGTPRAV